MSFNNGSFGLVTAYSSKRRMYCTTCGERIDSKAFCPYCGTRLAPLTPNGATESVRALAIQTSAPVYSAVYPPPLPLVYAPPPAYAPSFSDRIRQNLGRFRVFQQNVTCPHCGYFGPMGVVTEHKPFFANCFVLCLLAITMVGLAVVVLLAILGKLSRTLTVECPQCSSKFEVQGR